MSKIELARDVLACVSLMAIGIGCWILHPAACFIAVGTIVLGLIVITGTGVEDDT